MFYYVNPKNKYQFFSSHDGPTLVDDTPANDPEHNPVDNIPAKEPERNLVNALAALYRAYGGEEELKNNAVDIIYKIADVIDPGKDTSNNPPIEDSQKS